MFDFYLGQYRLSEFQYSARSIQIKTYPIFSMYMCNYYCNRQKLALSNSTDSFTSQPEHVTCIAYATMVFESVCGSYLDCGGLGFKTDLNCFCVHSVSEGKFNSDFLRKSC